MSEADQEVLDAAMGAVEELYTQLPTVECRGLCANSCGPISMSAVERQRIEARGVHIPEHVPVGSTARWAAGDMSLQCPALIDQRCSIYDIRPLICRAWGAGRGEMACKHGCKVTGLRIKTIELMKLLNMSYLLGGDTSEYGAIEPELAAMIWDDPDVTSVLVRYVNGEHWLIDHLEMAYQTARIRLQERKRS